MEAFFKLGTEMCKVSVRTVNRRIEAGVIGIGEH